MFDNYLTHSDDWVPTLWRKRPCYYTVRGFFPVWLWKKQNKNTLLSVLFHNESIVVFFLTFFFWPGESSGFPNTQTKGPVSEAESVSIHLCWAQQASWQGNTSGEGQQSTLWVCWRQWHNSNSCREHASSFLNLLSHCTSQACGRLTPKPGMELELWESSATSSDWTLDSWFQAWTTKDTGDLNELNVVVLVVILLDKSKYQLVHTFKMCRCK